MVVLIDFIQKHVFRCCFCFVLFFAVFVLFCFVVVVVGLFIFLQFWTPQLWVLPTLQSSLSGTFLQTLPDLVTPLKGHSLSPRICPATRSAPSERSQYSYDCTRSNLAPKHVRKHETYPPRVKKERKKRRRKEFCLDSNDCGFICAGVNVVGGYK